MNLNNIRRSPAFAAAAGGFLGLLLRSLLYRIGFDEAGMLPAFHPLQTATVILTLFMGAYLVLMARRSPENTQAHPVLLPAAGFLACCFLLLRTSAFRQMRGPLGLCCLLLNILAAASMFLCLLPQPKSRRISAFCHGLICTAYAADMLIRYRDWSGNPQLPDYCFHVLAGVAVTLCAYHTLALHTGLGKPRIHRFWCLSTLFLCILCLAGPEPRSFYFSGACWSMFCLFTPVPEEAEEENDDVSA